MGIKCRNDLLVIAECVNVYAKHREVCYHFHFNGYFDGHKIKLISFISNVKLNILPYLEYLLICSNPKIQGDVLIIELNSFRELS